MYCSTGDTSLRNFYKCNDFVFRENDESVAVFHNIDILKLNLDEKFKVNEKDFIIISATYCYIIVIEVKTTLGAGRSVSKSRDQLFGAKKDLEAWFGTEGLEHWAYIPLVYTERNASDMECNECNNFIIIGW